MVQFRQTCSVSFGSCSTLPTRCMPAHKAGEIYEQWSICNVRNHTWLVLLIPDLFMSIIQQCRKTLTQLNTQKSFNKLCKWPFIATFLNYNKNNSYQLHVLGLPVTFVGTQICHNNSCKISSFSFEIYHTSNFHPWGSGCSVPINYNISIIFRSCHSSHSFE